MVEVTLGQLASCSNFRRDDEDMLVSELQEAFAVRPVARPINDLWPLGPFGAFGFLGGR